MGEDAEKAAAFVDDFKSFDLKQDYPIGVDITPSEVMALRTMFGDTADPAKVEEAIANGGAAGFPGHNGYADRVEIHGMSHVSTRVSAAAKPHLES